MAAFLVVKSVDAYVKYSTVIEAETAQDAIDEAQRFDVEHDWLREREVEFDDADYLLEEVEELTPEEVEEEKSREPTDQYDLTDAERDMIIAALRFWQAGDFSPAELVEIAKNGRSDFMDDNSIDDLIEGKLNV
ncbi:hypothetical protein FHV99_004619 [Ochrobactrum sp. P20RRXII]|nr:hypothetical protein [Ochrobactrum sp. P20RRXII]NIH77367.1 hypothetical protein [Ochrobactrum sp. P20RRXII]